MHSGLSAQGGLGSERFAQRHNSQRSPWARHSTYRSRVATARASASMDRCRRRCMIARNAIRIRRVKLVEQVAGGGFLCVGRSRLSQ
jgi:hypothetical protein